MVPINVLFILLCFELLLVFFLIIGKSVLLRNANREVELCDEDGKLENKENFLENAVDPSTIQCPIPPGYWRLGTTHAKAKYILLRFAYKTDKKPYKAEKFSEYYKKHGNPNYGGLKGFISESKKQKFKVRNHFHKLYAEKVLTNVCPYTVFSVSYVSD